MDIAVSKKNILNKQLVTAFSNIPRQELGFQNMRFQPLKTATLLRWKD